MKISCKLGKGNIKIVEVSPDDPLYVLFEKLNIKDKGTKLYLMEIFILWIAFKLSKK